MIIPGHDIERQAEGTKHHESLVETNVWNNSNDLRYMVQMGECEETLVPKRRSYTALSLEKYPINKALTKDSRNDVDDYDDKNAFNGPREWS